MTIKLFTYPSIFEKKDIEGKTASDLLDEFITDFKHEHLTELSKLNPIEFIGQLTIIAGENSNG